ncbi:MAG: hypothetical protein H6511_06045 [Holophagales bacterium]|nr:hypothetical protein [Holophagales bacterium]
MRAFRLVVVVLAAASLLPPPLAAQEERPRPEDLIQEIRDRLGQLELEVREQEKEVLRRLGVLDVLARAVRDLANEGPMTGRDAARGYLEEASRRARIEPPLEGAVERVLDRCERVLDGGSFGSTGEDLARDFGKELLPLEQETLSRVQHALNLARQLDRVSRPAEGLAIRVQENAALALERLYFYLGQSMGSR